MLAPLMYRPTSATKMTIIATVFLSLLSLQAVTGADFTVDLRTGKYQKSASCQGIDWVDKPSTPFQNLGVCGCHVQGVLKLTFDPVNRTRAEITLSFDKPKGFSFDLGDSATNNGYGEDGGTQDSDAEVHAWDRDLRFYGKGVPDQPSQWYGLLHTAPKLLKNTVVINLQDQLVTAHRGSKYVHIHSFKTFNLNGQYDSEGPANYDVYFGLNRVISGSYRSGTGLCSVDIMWHSDKL